MKTLRSKTIRGCTVALKEYNGESEPFWRVEVLTNGKCASAPYDDYALALLAYIHRVNSLADYDFG